MESQTRVKVSKQESECYNHSEKILVNTRESRNMNTHLIKGLIPNRGENVWYQPLIKLQKGEVMLTSLTLGL